MRRGKFGPRAKPTVTRIELTGQLAMGLLQDSVVQVCARRIGTRLTHRRSHSLRRFQNLFAVGAPHLLYLRDKLHHSDPAKASLAWDVGPDEEGFLVRRHEHAERPAAAAGGLQSHIHVDAIDIRPFFAVHLDGNPGVVHQRGNFRVLEGLSLHDVTPVAGRIANGQEDGLVLGPRFLECFRSPGVPVYRIVGVLEQVWAFLIDQPIGLPMDFRIFTVFGTQPQFL